MSDRMDWLFGKTTTSTENAQSARMQWLTDTPDAARQEEKTNTAAVVAPTAAGDSSPGGTTVDQNSFSGTSGKMAKAVAQNVQSLPAERIQQGNPPQKETLSIADFDRLIAEKEAELAQWEEWDYDATSTTERQEYDKGIKAYEEEIERLRAAKWKAEKEAQYGALSRNADYETLSATVEKGPTAGFGIGFGTSWWGAGDPVYDYINDIDSTREKWKNPSTMGHSPYSIYDYMDKGEVKTYNYLYNTDGKEAAKKYLDYIEYDLNARRTQRVAESAAHAANKAPILSSAASIPANLVSGIGLLDVAGQNLKRKLSGEYVPIDYNRGTMAPTVITSTIRGAVAQNIADSTGVIALDESEHPYLSRILNGKSLGDVYQLGMSVADSLTVAYLTPFGKYGAVLLGGSAGTQGVLDALERGATDEQALRMGLLNGTFEALFEYVSLDKLLTSEPRKLVMALLRQGGVEASEEACTTLANDIADILVMAERSDYELKIKAYMESGMSREKAAKQALLDKCIELGWDTVGGFFSGGLSGGFSAAVSGTSTHRTAPVQTETQAQTLTEEQLLAVAQNAPQPPAEQKNTALSQAESTTVNTDPAQHTAAEQAVIDEYQASVDNRLLSFIERWKTLKNPNYKKSIQIPIAEITDRAAGDIRLLIGVDVTNYKHMLSGNALEHIEIRHGKNGEADHSLSDPNDIARMGYVLENYDVIEPVLDSQGQQKRSTQYSNADNTMAPLISFKKSVNGTYYVVEAVPDSAAKQLRVVSAYMQKKSRSTDQVLNMAKAPQLTSEVPHGADTPAGTPPVNAKALRITSKNAAIMPGNSILQSGKKYNSNLQLTAETGNMGERSEDGTMKGSPLGELSAEG